MTPTITELLAAASSRGLIKRLGEQVDRDVDARDALVALLEARGVATDATLSGKKLVKLALDRADAAQVISTPTRIDEAFTCSHCGLAVPPLGVTARDHCPRCLRSLHVDVVPGDRAADCGGLLDPVGCEIRHGDVIVYYRCRRCSAEKRNRAAALGELPDDGAAVRRLSKGEDPWVR